MNMQAGSPLSHAALRVRLALGASLIKAWLMNMTLMVGGELMIGAWEGANHGGGFGAAGDGRASAWCLSNPGRAGGGEK